MTRQIFAAVLSAFLLSAVTSPICRADDSVPGAAGKLAESPAPVIQTDPSRFAALAAATAAPEPSVSTVQTSSSSAPSTVRLTTSIQLSPEAMSMAQQLKLFDQIGRLNALREKIGEAKAESNTVEALSLRQDLAESKQNLMRRILKTALEADYVISAIEGEENDTSRVNRALSTKRDNAILINTVVDQLVNGIFWSLSGVFTLISVDHIQASNPEGVNAIVAGMLPAMLGLYSLYQATGPRQNLPAHPNMLAPIFGCGTTDDGYYPESVQSFLNAVPPGSNRGVSRKQALVQAWTEAKYIGAGGALPNDSKAALLSGTTSKRRALTLSLLQTRQVMLNDLRTVVCQMKRGLVELMPLLD